MSDDVTARGRLYRLLENLLDYASHSEVCGCGDDAHARDWVINIPALPENDVRLLLDALFRSR